MIDFARFFEAVVGQSPSLGEFFAEGAEIIWPSTEERFGVEDYVKVNCAYPGDWTGKIVKVLAGEPLVMVAKVEAKDHSYSAHVVSFITPHGDKIARLEEYWSEDGVAPDWRQELLHKGV